ncbi:hypothetical protein EU508_00220 [Pseudoalteromonas fuliginea]|uniref:Uncharacterized protein n=1 Tax=Pseudoalteromonas fuliginea TaxID=1872678 RepID=A0AB73BMA6_9GAMM|nr:hypothetical protein [Pseudoalteromonas fuliginea]KAA1166135.1 hypothetical protein EU508_00220 [Pseudoalteromonas fuliginea]
MKSIQLNIKEGGFDKLQGLTFEPEVVFLNLREIFPEVDKVEVDEFSSRIAWAESELENKESKQSEKFLRTIINDYKANLPAISFKIKNGKQTDIDGIVFKYGIRFFGNKEYREGNIPEGYIEKLESFLSKFSLKLTKS